VDRPGVLSPPSSRSFFAVHSSSLVPVAWDCVALDRRVLAASSYLVREEPNAVVASTLAHLVASVKDAVEVLTSFDLVDAVEASDYVAAFVQADVEAAFGRVDRVEVAFDLAASVLVAFDLAAFVLVAFDQAVHAEVASDQVGHAEEASDQAGRVEAASDLAAFVLVAFDHVALVQDVIVAASTLEASKRAEHSCSAVHSCLDGELACLGEVQAAVASVEDPVAFLVAEAERAVIPVE
jgi:hypothetical protein